jgi:hypothetical protein
MAVPGLVSPGVRGRGEETQLPAPSVVPILLLLLHRPCLGFSKTEISRPQKMPNCLHCRSHICATCLGGLQTCLPFG